jgi:hypothetical protein
MLSLVLAFALVLGAAQEPHPQTAQDPSSGAPRSLVISYSDGRVTTRVLTPRAGMWTGSFPRRGKPTADDGLPLTALKIDHVVERDVIVTVSLMYGTPHQRTIQVATVKLAGPDPVVVNELSAFGVDPITLALDVLPPAAFVQPTVGSASPLLDVSVDLLERDAPVYKITFRNRSSRAIMAVGFRMYRGGKEVGSGRRKTNRTTPVIEADGELSFTIQASGLTMMGFDRLEATGVLWADGTVEGDQELKRAEQALTAGYAQQLGRVLGVLGERTNPDGSAPPPVTIGEIRKGIEALPIEPEPAAGVASHASSIKIGCQQVKEAVLQDLTDYMKSAGAGAQSPARLWLEDARVRYSAWLARAGR